MSLAQLKQLTILPPNKTVVFYSPIDGVDTLVRTGTIPDGSCFVHALLHAYSKDYVCMNRNDRMGFVSRLRKTMARKMDKIKWESLSEGLISKISFQENVQDILTDIYNYILNDTQPSIQQTKNIINKLINSSQDTKDIYKVIFQLLPLTNTFEHNILPKVYEKYNNKSLEENKDGIVTESILHLNKILNNLGELNDKQVDFYNDKLEVFLHELIQEAENSAYKSYIKQLENSSVDVDEYTIGLISNKFNRDIYFIDASTRMPYRNASFKNIKNRKSILVMWTGGCHYEIVGRLLPGNKIERDFKSDDRLIECIKTYLCNPEKIPGLYPNLIPYLPKNIRKKLNIRKKPEPVFKYGTNDGKYVDSDEENSDDTEFDKSDVDQSDSSDDESDF